MEVWLEGLAMHLSVGKPLPQDLEFDIYHYTGKESLYTLVIWQFCNCVQIPIHYCPEIFDINR